ncbi:DedA family protein [Cytobacillus purgationiresistens]|uniref:Membrane protein DedA with SNARE-associated domain n=1 Tax=Cytobacillus purgationiresistens TaxID=863449 RepID=A0ABU0ACM0_9BACI|nr:DedA family protein [Cytobacillus purgationiresistens]MDQ0268552.1 membrane protein DedA with SNARE-associated domain [Cytobacillus purgationiresistens]
MELEFILDMIESNGYLGLFLWLWIGVFVFPVPNEVIVMTIGLATSLKVLHPSIAFISVYLGILAAMTTSYILGRLIGRPLLQYFQKRNKFTKVIDNSMKLMDKYHALSLSISYFIPGIRNFLPFLYGFSKLKYRTFALFAYSGALLWLAIAFPLGYIFGEHIEIIIAYEQEIFMVVGVIAIFYVLFKIRKHRRNMKKEKLETKDTLS